MNISEIKNQVLEKGRVGEFAYARHTEKKCFWIVFDRRSGEILDETQNLSSACRSANYFYQLEKSESARELLKIN